MGNLKLLVVMMLLSMAVSVPALAAFEVHPGLKSIEVTEVTESNIHRLITSRVKRQSGDVRPETEEFVRGVKQSETFSVSRAHDPDEIVTFYRDQFSNLGQIIFECQGRDCGPSNYWSNQVFELPRLYGPLEYQHYILAKLDSEQIDYVVLYFSQRGTGARYMHQELIGDVNDRFVTDNRLVASMLRLQRRFVFDDTPAMLAVVRDVVNENSDFHLAVVAHAGPLTDDTLEGSVKKTTALAEQIKQKLTEMGADTSKLSAIGAGPTAPTARANGKRLELVKLN